MCDYPELKPEGACRLCLVEVEKQRALQPACTFPVTEGMVVRTETEKVVASRKMTLQVLFSERSHYCMFCPMSGSAESTDCELQRLAYRYGLDNWPYAPDYAKNWAVDATRRYFVMDHGRCILCRRCVRACNVVAANHTLGVHQRGARTLIGADDDVPFGESSCISCGTCLEVCPTGALTDRRSAFLGHHSDVTRTKAVCLECAVACGTYAVTRENQLIRVESDWKAPSGGLLCAKGRFEVTERESSRILRPMIRQEGRLVEASWEEALAAAAGGLQAAQRVAGLVSPRMTNESLAAFTRFFQEVLESKELALMYGEAPPLNLGQAAALADVAASDCLVVIAGDPPEHQEVIGMLIKRALDREAKLIVVSDVVTSLDRLAQARLRLADLADDEDAASERRESTAHMRMAGISQVREAVEAAQRPVVLYGAGVSTRVCAALRSLAAKVRFLPLVKGTNAVGAGRLGLEARPVHGEATYVLLGDDLPEASVPPRNGFRVVHAAWASAWTEGADVVLPAPTWAEQGGHIINLEGREIEIGPVLRAPESVPTDLEALRQLSRRMGRTLSYEAIPGIKQTV